MKIKYKFFQKIFIIFILLILSVFQPVFANTVKQNVVKKEKNNENKENDENKEDNKKDKKEDSFDDFTDLADLKIHMDNETGIVSIEEIEELKKDSYGAQKKAWNKFFSEYRGLLVGASGVCTLTFVVLFLIAFARLGKSSNNSQERSRVGVSLLWLIIAAAGFGSLTFILSLAFGFFK